MMSCSFYMVLSIVHLIYFTNLAKNISARRSTDSVMLLFHLQDVFHNIRLISQKSVHKEFFGSPRKHASIFYCCDTFKADMLTLQGTKMPSLICKIGNVLEQRNLKCILLCYLQMPHSLDARC